VVLFEDVVGDDDVSESQCLTKGNLLAENSHEKCRLLLAAIGTKNKEAPPRLRGLRKIAAGGHLKGVRAPNPGTQLLDLPIV
jgi:hypothetical protein